jgi:DNA-binding CsgD family transcriptional regulator
MPVGTDRERCQHRFVGRGAELLILQKAIAAGRSGDASAVLVRGPVGIGKSRLLGAALGGVSSKTLLLRASGEDRMTGLPWGVVRELFASLGLCLAEAASSRLLQDCARSAVHVLGSPEGDSGRSAGSDTYAVQHSLYWLIVKLCVRRPLVIAIENVDFCDESSLHWLDFLLRRAEGLPLCVVLSERTGGSITTPPVLTDFIARGRGRVVELGPLDHAGVADLVVEILGERPSADLVDACAEVSGGNPLVLEHLLGELGRGGSARLGTLVERVRDIGRDVMAVSMANRVLRQPEHVGKIAKVIAVTGAQEIDLLAALSGVPMPLVRGAVDVLRRNDVLGEDAEFRHDPMRTAVLGQMSEAERTWLRSRAARLWSDIGRPSESVAELLLQLPRASESWMLDVLSDAATEAGRRGDPRAAARYLTAILAVAPDEAAVRVQLASVLAQVDPAGAIAHLDRALDLITEPRKRATIAVQIAMMSGAIHRGPEAVEVLSAALEDLLEDAGEDPTPADQELRTLVEAALIVTGFQQRRTVTATRGRILVMSVPAGETMAERQKLAGMALSTAMRGVGVGEVVEQAKRALLLDDGGHGGWAALGSMMVLRLADELEGAAAAVEKLVVRSQEQVSAWTYHLAIRAKVENHIAEGEVLEAAADVQMFFDVVGQESLELDITLSRTTLARVLALQGKMSEAEALLAQVSRPRFEDAAWEYPEYLQVRALVRAQLGDHSQALDLLRVCGRSLEEADFSNPVFVPWWVDLAVLLTETGRAHEALDAVQHGEDLAGRWDTARSRGLALFARGVITPGADGIEWLEEAVRVLRDSPARLELARAEHWLGQAFLDVGDKPVARLHLREAINLSTRSGARFLAVQTRDLLVAAGGRMRELPESRSDALTGSERRVAELALKGASNREIAQALFVTSRTVEVHLTNAYRKLDVIGRPGLASGMVEREQGLG